jgi:ABC-2 type transport system permease protein
MNALLAVAAKEARLLLRDPVFLALQLVAPLVLLVVFGTLFSVMLRAAPLAVADLDGSAETRRLVGELAAGGAVRPVATDPRRALEGGDALAGMWILPAGGRSDDRPRIQAVVDGADGAARALLAEVERVMAVRAPRAVPAVGSVTWYNGARRDSWFFVPGVVALLLFAVSAILPGLAMVRERQAGAWLALDAAPVGDATLLGGKLLPYTLQLGVLAAAVLLVAHLGFGLPVRGPTWVLAAGTLLLLLAGIGLGASIGVSALHEDMAWRRLLILVVLPGFVLSGFIYPISSMPALAQVLSRLFPVRPYLELLRGVLLKGAGADVLAAQLAVLALFAAGGLAAATILVRRSRRPAR